MTKMNLDLRLELEVIVASIEAAGFKSEYRRLKIFNDLNVRLDDWLNAIGFQKKIQIEGEKEWATFTHEKFVGFRISYNNKLQNYATTNLHLI